MTAKYLADTHILFWAFTSPDKISAKIRKVLIDPSAEIFFSQISLWEISIKYRIGKLSISGLSPEQFYSELSNSFFLPLPTQSEHLVSSHNLAAHHKDPFDRMIFGKPSMAT